MLIHIIHDFVGTSTVDLLSKEWAWVLGSQIPTEAAERPQDARAGLDPAGDLMA